MASTFTRTRSVQETEIAGAQRRKEREEEAKKIVVDLKPWGDGGKPSPILSFDNDQIHSPPRVQSYSRSTRSRNSTFWSPQEGAISTHTPKPSSHSKCAFSPRSVGSLSSQCTVTSFVSPLKAGIRGCQNNYNPYLHEARGPCELCVFRLDADEKMKLDLNGRHLKVMFTTGGCADCLEFPRSFDEPPVRLCVKCFAVAHRPVKVRTTPGKGNMPGYSFAKAGWL